MRCTRLGLWGALAALFVFLLVSNLPPAQNAPATTRHPRLLHIKDKVEHGDGTADSSNWSGYAVTGTNFSSAEGSWVVPPATCAGRGDTYAALWVGIDGYASSTVEQTGTLIECVGRRAEYFSWYEFYPSNLIEISSVPVGPGNTVSASVVYNNGEFTAKIANTTTGKSFSITKAVAGAERTSAEWITEAPCCTVFNGILPLADFGTAKFGAGNTDVAGTNYATEGTSASEPIGGYPSANVIQIAKTPSRSSPQTSTCSALADAGTSFTCTWAN
jgi:peptidase A4-like protein